MNISERLTSKIEFLMLNLARGVFPKHEEIKTICDIAILEAQVETMKQVLENMRE